MIKPFFVEDFLAAVEHYNKVYLPGLVSLHRHYAITNNCLKKKKVAQMIQQLVAQEESIVQDSFARVLDYYRPSVGTPVSQDSFLQLVSEQKGWPVEKW